MKIFGPNGPPFPPRSRLCCHQGPRGISTVSMMYTVALAVWTLPHTTWAPVISYEAMQEQSGCVLASNRRA
jgi:hypothetical protein